MSLLAAPPAAPPVTIDPTKARLLAQWKHGSPLLGCRVDPSGKYVFAGAQDNAVVRWEVATGKKATLTGHPSWVRALAFAAPGVWGRSAPKATWVWGRSAPKATWVGGGHGGLRGGRHRGVTP